MASFGGAKGIGVPWSVRPPRTTMRLPFAFAVVFVLALACGFPFAVWADFRTTFRVSYGIRLIGSGPQLMGRRVLDPYRN